MTTGIAFAAGLTLGTVLGVVAGVLFLAFWMGAFRRTPEEQVADDLEQMQALRASGETGIA